MSPRTTECKAGRQGRRETKTGERCKVQKQVRNSRVTPSSRPLPTTDRQTAGHTQARPPGTREHAAKWRPESQGRGCPCSAPSDGAAGRARAQTLGLGLSARNGWKSVYPPVPTSGSYQAGPKVGPRCEAIRRQASTREGGKCGRGRAGRAPSNTSVLSEGAWGRQTSSAL